MRTTIEITDEHRAALLQLAARRGQKGFSAIVSEAIEAYLKAAGEEAKRRREALGLRGALSADEAERLRAATAEIRKTWR
jgi:predicted transcriptional regulator